MSAAPALSRGIVILQLLARQDDGLRLDDLARASAIPKASLLRLLGVLIDLGLVMRQANDSRYLACQHLIPCTSGSFQARIEQHLRRLADSCGHSCEWWQPSAAGMVLSLRAEAPAGEVAVRARIGFVRAWDGELDAVASLGQAHWPQAPAPAGSRLRYRDHGCIDTWPLAAVKAHLAAQIQHQEAVDPWANSNGVRRLAHLVTIPDGRLGVLAVAQCLVCGADPQTDPLRDLLHHHAARLAQAPGD